MISPEADTTKPAGAVDELLGSGWDNGHDGTFTAAYAELRRR